MSIAFCSSACARACSRAACCCIMAACCCCCMPNACPARICFPNCPASAPVIGFGPVGQPVISIRKCTCPARFRDFVKMSNHWFAEDPGVLRAANGTSTCPIKSSLRVFAFHTSTFALSSLAYEKISRRFQNADLPPSSCVLVLCILPPRSTFA